MDRSFAAPSFLPAFVTCTRYVPGGDLTKVVAHWITKSRSDNGHGLLAVPEAEVRYYFRQIITAIDHMHRNKVVHRDLK